MKVRGLRLVRNSRTGLWGPGTDSDSESLSESESESEGVDGAWVPGGRLKYHSPEGATILRATEKDSR